MKKLSIYTLTLLLGLLLTGADCSNIKHHDAGQRFIIHNNSDKQIVILLSENNSMEHKDKFCIQQLTSLEYGAFMHHYMIEPNSYKNLERRGIGERVLKRPNDILSISIFNRIDMDTMSCEEFKHEFPLKHEWKVTLADMEACDWTLIYAPKVRTHLME